MSSKSSSKKTSRNSSTVPTKNDRSERDSQCRVFELELSDTNSRFKLGYDTATITKKAVQIEKSCYNRCLDKCTEECIAKNWANTMFRYCYSATCYKIAFHLEDETAVKRLFNAECDLTELDLCPDAVAEEYKLVELQRQQKLEEKVGKTVVCRGCKSTNVSWQRYQGRGSDELENYAFKCLTCNWQWHS